MIGSVLMCVLLAADEGAQEKMNKARAEEMSLLLRISQLERLLYQRDEELRLLKKTMERVSTEVAEKEAEVAVLRRDTDAQRLALAVRVTSLFKFSRNGTVRMAFGSDSLDDLYRRVKFSTAILRRDRKNFMRFFSSLQALEKDAEELRRGQAALSRVAEEISRKREAVESRQKEKAGLLASVREEKTLYRKALKDMDRAGEEVDSMVQGLKAPLFRLPNGTPPGSFSDMKGRLPLPAAGKIIGFFGKSTDPRYHTVIFRKGILIDAKEGDEVKAVADGTVIYTGWFQGYGLIVLLDHGGGYFSLSAHLSRNLVDFNDAVKAGRNIALAGDTGSLEGPGLYFELRYHGKPINPLEWLEFPSH